MAALVQQNTVNTTTSGPASIAASLSGASTAGNLLLMWVVVHSSNSGAAITTPANWTLIASQQYSGTNRIIALFAFPNCTVLTTVTVTITNVTGSAVATMLEFSGMGTNPPVELLSPTTGSGDGVAIPAANQFTPPRTIGAVWAYAIGFAAGQSWTPGNSQGFATMVTGTATGATQNASMSSTFGITNGPGMIQNGGILQNLAIFGMILVRISGIGGPLGYGQGGVVQTLAGNGSPNMQGSFSNG